MKLMLFMQDPFDIIGTKRNKNGENIKPFAKVNPQFWLAEHTYILLTRTSALYDYELEKIVTAESLNYGFSMTGFIVTLLI